MAAGSLKLLAQGVSELLALRGRGAPRSAPAGRRRRWPRLTPGPDGGFVWLVAAAAELTTRTRQLLADRPPAPALEAWVLRRELGSCTSWGGARAAASLRYSDDGELTNSGGRPAEMRVQRWLRGRDNAT